MENGASPSSNSTQQPAVYILIQSDGNGQDQYRENYPKKTGLILSSIQLSCAILSIITQVVMIVEAHKYYHYLAYVGSGVWCGVFFAVAGGLGIFAAMRPSNCSVVASMVMSIIASVFCIPMLTFSVIGLFQNPRNYYSDSYIAPSVNSMLVINIIQIIVILTEVVVAIVSSAYGCRACCCRPRSTPGTVMYNPSGKPNEGQFVQVPLNTLPTAVNGILPTALTDNKTDQADSLPDYDDESFNGGKYQKF